MPTCLALNESGRGPAIPTRLIGGADATIAICRMRLESIRGDWFEDRGLGLPWPTWWGDPTTPDVIIEGAIRRQLTGIDGLVEVREVVISRAGETMAIQVEVAVREDDALTVYRIGDDVDEAAPWAWYTLVDVTTRSLV